MRLASAWVGLGAVQSGGEMREGVEGSETGEHVEAHLLEHVF